MPLCVVLLRESIGWHQWSGGIMIIGGMIMTGSGSAAPEPAGRVLGGGRET